MRRVIVAFLAVALAACTIATAVDHLAAADPAMARIQRGYDAARSIAALFLPYLPPARAARLAALGLVVERALAAARIATGLAARRAALARAEAATAAYALAAGG